MSASTEDYYRDNFKSVRNLLCQLNSIQQVTSLWRASGKRYHAVLYIRPDMLYNCPFPVNLLDDMKRNSLYVADFHHWHGYNDRFAMGPPEVAALWGERFHFALSTCMQRQIHAETLVKSLLEHHHISVELIPFYFFRLRASGKLEDRDFRPKWKNHTIPRCDTAMFEPFI